MLLELFTRGVNRNKPTVVLLKRFGGRKWRKSSEQNRQCGLHMAFNIVTNIIIIIYINIEMILML